MCGSESVVVGRELGGVPAFSRELVGALGAAGVVAGVWDLGGGCVVLGVDLGGAHALISDASGLSVPDGGPVVVSVCRDGESMPVVVSVVTGDASAVVRAVVRLCSGL